MLYTVHHATPHSRHSCEHVVFTAGRTVRTVTVITAVVAVCVVVLMLALMLMLIMPTFIAAVVTVVMAVVMATVECISIVLRAPKKTGMCFTGAEQGSREKGDTACTRRRA